MDHEFQLQRELESKLNNKRMRTWRWTTAVSNIPKGALTHFAPIQKPQLGDLALVQVMSIGRHNVVEQASGSRLQIFPGSVLVCAFANRYAPDEFEGCIPQIIHEGDELDLLNLGGVIGTALAGNRVIGEPTRVKLLSFFKDKEGRVANTTHYQKKSTSNKNNNNQIKLIIVTGTTMNSGKSNTAKAIVYSLTSAGETVVAAKVTGTAAKKDALLMKTAGALEICDFVDFGYPSTYLLDRENVIQLFWRIYDYLSSKIDRDGYMVIEIADGIFQREAEFILLEEDIKQAATHFVFSCCDSLSAVAGVNILQENFNIQASAISGPAANSDLGLKEVRRFLKDFPAFNNMIIDAPAIANIFMADKPKTTVALEKTVDNVEVLPETIVKCS